MQSPFTQPVIYIDDPTKHLGVINVHSWSGQGYGKDYDLNLTTFNVDVSKLKPAARNALTEFIVDGKILCVPIGRNNLGVQILNVTVSRIHCLLCICPKTAAVKLVDLCSSNGTSFCIENLTKNTIENHCELQKQHLKSSSGSNSCKHSIVGSSSNGVSMVISSFYTRGSGVSMQFTRRYDKRFFTLRSLITFAPHVLIQQDNFADYVSTVKLLRSKFIHFLWGLTHGVDKYGNHVVPYRVRAVVDISVSAFSTVLSEMLGCKWKKHLEIF